MLDAFATAGSSPPQRERVTDITVRTFAKEFLLFTPHTPSALLWLSAEAPLNSGWLKTEIVVGPKYLADEFYERLAGLASFKVGRTP